MPHRLRFIVIPILSAALIAAVPRHVPTADYWAGYAGTKMVPAPVAAKALTWAETDEAGSELLAPLGVRTLFYTDPNRLQPENPLYRSDESEYAHTCSRTRVYVDPTHPTQVLGDPYSPVLEHLWKKLIERQLSTGARFAAVFDDDADGPAYSPNSPCAFIFDRWLEGELQLDRGLGYPLVYNGLGFFNGHAISKTIELNAGAIGGMMEQCYSMLLPDHRAGGWRWRTTEATEIAMAAARKYFFCYGRDTTPANEAYDARLYTYASYLLTYNPRTTVLWEYYATPSRGHVMPESRLVALDPLVKRVRSIDDLRTRGGVYVREYARCFIEGRAAGPCVAAVNPDTVAHPLALRGYRRTLELRGSGVFDGGSVAFRRRAPPPMLPPLGAIVAFR